MEHRCSRCKKPYPRTTEFYSPKATARDGMRGVCRECVRRQNNERQMRYLETHNITRTYNLGRYEGYVLLDDPDKDTGLQVRGYNLRITPMEMKSMLKMGCFTPGSVLRKGKQTYRVVMGSSGMQELAA